MVTCGFMLLVLKVPTWISYPRLHIVVLAVNNNAFMEIFDWASKSMQIISHSKPTDNVLESNLGPNMEPYNPVEKKVPWND